MDMNNVRRLLDRVRDQASALAQARKLYEHRLAPEFNPFEFIETGEVQLSRLIAWFLDPRGKHGQGTSFLIAFLDMLELRDWSRDELDRANVRCEASTEIGRRIDIVIQSGAWTIGIENKLRGAADQNEQVFHYLDHLDHVAVGRQRCLVYLSIDGEPPTEHSIAKDHSDMRIANRQLLSIGVSDVILWLQACRSVCRAARVTAFIEDFESLLEKDFKGNRDMTEREKLIDLVTESKDTVASGFKLILAGSDIKKRLLEKLAEAVVQQATSEWQQINLSFEERKKYQGFSIRHNALADVAFRIEFQGTNFDGMIFGVHTKLGQPFPAITSALNGKLGTGITSPAWPWYQYVAPNNAVLDANGNWGVSESPWIEVVDGTMAGKIAAAAKTIYASLGDGGLLGSNVSAATRQSPT